LARLQSFSDTLITVPNDRLLKIAPKDLSLELAFRLADDVLRQSIQGITELITQPGLINVDFAHIRRMMRTGGGSLLSIGYGQGPNKAHDAIQQALHHPLLDSIPIENATGIIANFTGSTDLSFIEVSEALTALQRKASSNADIIPGIINDERMFGRVQIILIITGLGATPLDTRSTVQPIHQTASTPLTHAAQSPVPQHAYADSTPAEMVNSHSNLDLPAFMRRRVH